MEMVIIGLVGTVIGYLLGAGGTRRYYEEILDSFDAEREQSEEDFLSYAAADKDTELFYAKEGSRADGKHGKR